MKKTVRDNHLKLMLCRLIDKNVLNRNRPHFQTFMETIDVLDQGKSTIIMYKAISIRYQ